MRNKAWRDVVAIRARADFVRSLMRPNDVEYRLKAEFLAVASREINKIAGAGSASFGRGYK